MVAVGTFCYLSSPLHLSDKKTYLIPPIQFENQVYIINEKIFYEVLTRINKFQEFNQHIREKGYYSTRKWLCKYGLLNTGFLESVCIYNIEFSNFKEIIKYSHFQKDCNGNPFITGEYLKNLFKKVFIYNYFKERYEEFNDYVSKELDTINQELANIDDITNYTNRKNFYKNNIFSYLLENFLINIDSILLENLQLLENINIHIESHLNTNDLFLYKVGSPVRYKNFKYHLINTSYQECIKNNSYFKLFIDFSHNSTNTTFKNKFTNILLNQMKALTDDKLTFDLNYINKLKNEAKELSVKENNLPALINTNFNSIKDSNILLCPSDKTNSIIAALTLETANLEKLNSLIFDKSSIKSELVKLSVENELIPYYTICGYGNIHFN